MRKILGKLGVAFVLAMSVLFVFGCADANGLHNQNAANVTFVFKNMGESIEGAYAVPGNFNNWDNSEVMVSMKGGSGTTAPVSIATPNIQFTLVKTGEWTRSWYPAVKGNGSDGGVMQNFYIDALDLSAGEITLVIDGSSVPAIPKAE